MWSGPRNISTAMMRAFENRPDTVVVDEPLYAAYLARTGIDHPVRDEVIASQPTDLADGRRRPVRAAAARPPRPLRQAHGAPRLARHGPGLDAALPQRAADPRPGRGRRLVRARPGDLRAGRHRAAPAGVAAGAVGRARRRGADHRRGRLPARARGAPALAVRLAGHPVHRPDAVLAAGPARLRRRVGAALVRRRLVLHRVRALAPARDSASPTTTPPSPRRAARSTTALHARRVRV